MNIFPRTAFLFAIALAQPLAQAAEPSAEEIAKKALDNGMFAASNGKVALDLEISKGGAVVRTRKIVSLIKRDDQVIRAFVLFEAPAEVAGTKFLSLKDKAGETEQYIYLPAFKKVKRVVGTQRSQSFMGTDFNYADLEGRKVEDYQYQRLPDDKLEGEACWVLEAKPRAGDKELYGRTVTWVHQGNGLPLKAEYFDASGKELLKRLTVKKLAKKDEHWLAMDTLMESMKEGTQTRLKVTAADFKSPIPDESLTRAALEH
jgi:hypothetical protein